MPPERLTAEELKSFTEAVQDQEGERKLLLRTLLNTGPRLHEVINLRVEDVSIEEGHLTIRNPLCSGSRQVPLADTLLTKLRDHIAERDSGFLFGGFEGGRITEDQVCRLVRRTAHRAGIKRRVSVHEIRESVADLLLNQPQMPFEQIAAFLGIVGTETTPVPMVRFLES